MFRPKMKVSASALRINYAKAPLKYVTVSLCAEVVERFVSTFTNSLDSVSRCFHTTLLYVRVDFSAGTRLVDVNIHRVFIPIIKGKHCKHVDCQCLVLSDVKLFLNLDNSKTYKFLFSNSYEYFRAAEEVYYFVCFASMTNPDSCYDRIPLYDDAEYFLYIKVFIVLAWYWTVNVYDGRCKYCFLSSSLTELMCCGLMIDEH